VGPGDKVVFIEEDDMIVIRSPKDLIYEVVDGFRDLDKIPMVTNNEKHFKWVAKSTCQPSSWKSTKASNFNVF
jgi:hypothetical protein